MLDPFLIGDVLFFEVLLGSLINLCQVLLGASSQCRSTWGSAGDNKSPEAGPAPHRARAIRQRDKLMPGPRVGGNPGNRCLLGSWVLGILRLVEWSKVKIVRKCNV